MGFRGLYEHNLDAKDRLTVPARFRAALADGVVLSAGFDTCVSVFTPDGYEHYTQKFLGELNPLSSQGRRLRRFFHGNAHEDTLDSANRIRVPKHLVEHAGLEGPCVVVGSDDSFEIWAKEKWDPYSVETNDIIGDTAENLAHED